MYVCMSELSVMNEGGSTNVKRSGLRDIYLNDHDQTVDFETLSDVESYTGQGTLQPTANTILYLFKSLRMYVCMYVCMYDDCLS